MESLDIERHLQIEQARLPRYRTFCGRYGLEPFETVVALYDIDELEAFMPPYPTEEQKKALQTVIGARGIPGYMDYIKSNNTFELIMQFQEQLQDFDQHAMFFHKGDAPEDHS